MRAVNARLAVIMIVCSLVLVVAVFGIHAVQVNRQAEIFLKRARHLKEEGSLGNATGYLQRYVRLVPGDVDAQEELGRLLAETGNRPAAFAQLEQVLRLDPGRDESRRDLVEVCLDLGRHSDAAVHLERLLEKYPEDAELLVNRARCEIAAGDYEAAKKTLSDEVIGNPELSGHLEAYMLLADLLWRHLDPPKEAVKRLNWMVENNPESAEALVRRGEFLRTHSGRRFVQEALGINELLPTASDGSAEEDETPTAAEQVAELALADARAALEMGPAEEEMAPEEVAVRLDALLLAGQCSNDLNQVGEARDYFQRGLELDPNSPKIYVAMSESDLRENQPEEAIARLEQGLRADPRSIDLLWNLTNIQIELGEIDSARDRFDSLRQTNAQKSTVDYLEARLLVAQGQWLQASQRLESLRPELFEYPALMKQANFWLGRCYHELGNADLELSAYRRASEADPFWIPAREGIALALLRLGQINAALDEYRMIARISRSHRMAWTQVARLLILANLNRPEQDRDWGRVEAYLDDKAAGDKAAGVPVSPYVPIFRAEVIVAKSRLEAAEQFEEAERVLMEAKEKQPDETPLWLALADLLMRKGDFERCRSTLDEAWQRLGDLAELRLARGRYLVYQFGRADDEEAQSRAVEELRELSSTTEGFDEGVQQTLARTFAVYFLAIEEYEDAGRLCREVAERDPHDLRIRLLLFDLALRAGDPGGLKEVLEEVQEIEGNGPLWRYGEAIRLALLGQEDPRRYDEALNHLSEARLQRPGWSRIPLLAARIKEMQGDEGGAIEGYLEAIELGERGTEIIGRTVRLLHGKQRFGEAEELLALLDQQQVPFSNELLRVAAEVSLNLGDLEEALQLGEQAVANSRLESDLRWLGMVLSLRGRHKEAEEKLREAIALAPQASEPRVVLVRALCRAGEEQAAVEEIQAAEKELPPVEAPLVAAICYEELSKFYPEETSYGKRAEEFYQKALETGNRDPDVIRAVVDFYMREGKADEAEPHLRLIAGKKVRAEETTVFWARRNLAVMLAARGRYADYLQAQALIDENLAEQQVDEPDDQRAKAIILATYPIRESRREAIRLLEEYLQMHRKRGGEPSAEDHFILFQLYNRDGSWARAAAHMRSTLARQGREPRYLIAYIRALLRRDELNEARLHLGVLKRAAPDDARTVATAAEVLFAEGRHDEVVTSLAAYCGGSPVPVNADPARIRLAAELMSRFGEKGSSGVDETASRRYLGKAEELYREYVERVPESGLLVARFFALHGRVDEALSQVEGRLQKVTAEEMAGVCSLILRDGRATRGQIQRAEKMLEEALAREPDSAVLKLALADLLAWRGDYGRAEKAYRFLLSENPNSVVAMNNLAIMLALHGTNEQNRAEALDLMERAIRLAGPLAELLDSRALVYLGMDQPEKALRDAKDVLADESSAIRLFHHAWASQEAGDRESARESLEAAREMGLTARMIHPMERKAFERVNRIL